MKNVDLHLLMNYILQIDTSSENGIIILSAEGKIIGERRIEDSRSQASTINSFIGELMTEANIVFSSLAAVAVIGGPGSYTGLRIGMATAKGICYAYDLPLIVHSKLKLLALQNTNRTGQLGGIIKAREGEFYWTIYEESQEVISPKHSFEEEIAGFIFEQTIAMQFTGEMSEALTELLYQKGGILVTDVDINTQYWSEECQKSYLNETFMSLSYSEPEYLKKPFVISKST
jgi:tRNA threonylcarbamoyladenosine biosynthesis protein TsaB